MANWKLTNWRVSHYSSKYDLLRDGEPVLSDTLYMVVFDYVLTNGADADTYIEDHMSAPQTVAELRAEQAEQERRFAQD